MESGVDFVVADNPHANKLARGVCGARARADQSEDQRRSRGKTSQIELGGFWFEVNHHATSTHDACISQNQPIHFRPEETIQCFLRLTDHGLVLIKGRIEYHRYARQLAEAFDQLVISRIG
jgi:hypothetical protein